MNGYERRTESKKERIRTAAFELFCMYGVNKTSVNEIAEKAGVAPASIYNYFGSKEGLLRETVINLLENSWKVKKELWGSDLPFPELVKHAILMKDDFIDYINLDALSELLNADPEIIKLIDDFNKNRYPQIVKQFIEKGRREGYIRKELSIEAATIYLKVYQNVIHQPDMLKNKNKDSLKELCDLMLYGLAGQPIVDTA